MEEQQRNAIGRELAYMRSRVERVHLPVQLQRVLDGESTKWQRNQQNFLKLRCYGAAYMLGRCWALFTADSSMSIAELLKYAEKEKACAQEDAVAAIHSIHQHIAFGAITACKELTDYLLCKQEHVTAIGWADIAAALTKLGFHQARDVFSLTTYRRKDGSTAIITRLSARTFYLAFSGPHVNETVDAFAVGFTIADRAESPQYDTTTVRVVNP